jgi:ABC-2 type transport system permease protein
MSADRTSSALSQAGLGHALRRIGAMVLRHVYLYRSSWPRLLELMYWPIMQMVMWGFMTLFLVGQASLFAQVAGLLIAAVLLWDVLVRSQLGLGISFLEELWSRNLGHILVSPIRPIEFVVSLVVMSLIRTLIGLLPAAVLAIFLYDYSIFSMGLPLIAFFVNLVLMGWAVGLAICGVILRWGLGAENLAWLAMFAIAPICGIYYPLSVLPEWLQPVARALPAAHVFEGMRAVLIDKSFRLDLLVNALLLNVAFVLASVAVFLRCFRAARIRGLILQIGE